MKKIIRLFLIVFFCYGCTLVGSLGLEDTEVKFKIENNRYLIITNGKNLFYVSSESVSEKFSHGKDIGIIFKNADGTFSIERNLSNKTGISAMIGGIDFSKKLIEINGKVYNIKPNRDEKDDELILNCLFENGDGKLRLSSTNYEEFIDDYGNVYKTGREVREDEVNRFLYPIELNGKEIYSITFNKKTGKIYDAKEKTSMLMNGEEAKEIKTINYCGIYETNLGEKSVQIDYKYYKLNPK